MICTQCGATNDDSAASCARCGTLLRQPANTEPAEPEPPEPVIVPNYLVESILATVFCCMPAGIVAIVYAAQVNSHLANGNIAAARESSAKAAKWARISSGIIVGIFLLYILCVILGSLFGRH